jgi:hypothetical protein
MNVNKTGRHDEAFCVDDSFSRSGTQISDLQDFSLFDADIRLEPRIAGSVNDVRVPDQEIKGFV